MAIIGKYTATGSIIRSSDSAAIPPDPANVDYQAMLAAVANGDTITPYAPPPVTADQVQAEAQRRFMAATADARALLQVLGTPIPADVAALAQAIIAKGNEIAAMAPIPQDYAADSRWPSA